MHINTHTYTYTTRTYTHTYTHRDGIKYLNTGLTDVVSKNRSYPVKCEFR